MAGKLTEPVTVKLDDELYRYCQGIAAMNEKTAAEYVRGLIEADRERALMQFTLLAQALGENGSIVTGGSSNRRERS